MDRFVVDLVESPSVSRNSAVARTFGPAVSEEYSRVGFAGGGGGVADAYPLVVVESDSALVSGLRPVVSDPALVSALQLVVSDTARMSVPPVAGCEFPAVLLGKVAFDAVGLGVGPPCFRVDSEDALQKRTDERALLAPAALGVIPEMKLVTKFWMMGRRETTTGVKSLEYILQMTASVWMPFNQTCEEESGDANFDSFKTAPWDAGGTQRDEVQESMCRTRVHNIDGWATKNTECVFPTNMLLAMNCPHLKLTPGEDDAS